MFSLWGNGAPVQIALIIPEEPLLSVVAADFVALRNALRKTALKVRIQIEWLQFVAGQRE